MFFIHEVINTCYTHFILPEISIQIIFASVTVSVYVNQYHFIQARSKVWIIRPNSKSTITFSRVMCIKQKPVTNTIAIYRYKLFFKPKTSWKVVPTNSNKAVINLQKCFVIYIGSKIRRWWFTNWKYQQTENEVGHQVRTSKYLPIVSSCKTSRISVVALLYCFSRQQEVKRKKNIQSYSSQS